MKRPPFRNAIVVDVLVLLVVPVLLVGLVVHAADRQQNQRLDHIALPLHLRLREHHMVRFPAACASPPPPPPTSTPLHRLALRRFAPVAVQSRQRRGAPVEAVGESVGVAKRVADRREVHGEQSPAGFRGDLPRAGVGGGVVASVGGVRDVETARGAVVGEHRGDGGGGTGGFHRVEAVEARVLSACVGESAKKTLVVDW